MPEQGLRRRLGRELLLQAVYISLAVLVSVFAAARVVENVLTRQALVDEASYYWEREAASPGGPLPDTMNLTGYRPDMGDGLPDWLPQLEPGFHALAEPRNVLVYVSDQHRKYLYLVFESGQVGRLIALFGLVPLALVLIVIYISLYSAYRVSRRAVSPIENLAEQVKHLNPADPDPELFVNAAGGTGDDEIGVLAEALQDLARRVDQFSNRERRFTRDASHELRTPLTVIKIAVDRLLRDNRLDEGSEETLLRIRSSCDDMERLTSAFLLMARDSDSQLDRDWVCVNDLVEAEFDRARIIYPDSQISTSIHATGKLLVEAPESVLESVIGNLLRNALAYTDAGQVAVYIDQSSIAIEDTGPGMSPGEVEKAFQPYYRNQRQRGGFGVGLTIVRRLTDRFDWALDVDSEVSQGTRVQVSFPNARFHTD